MSEKIKIPGFVKTERDFNFDDKDQLRNAGIRLYYSNLFGQIMGLKEGILLEVGFDQTSPNEKRTISSWLNKKAISINLDIKDNRAIDVKCYNPEYTFVEKLQTISTKYRQQQEKGEMPINFMRHYYDIYQLLQLDRVRKFIGTDEYFKHKKKRFRTQDETDLTKNEAFILSNANTKRKFVEAFNKTNNLYYKNQPALDDIINEIKKFIKQL